MCPAFSVGKGLRSNEAPNKKAKIPGPCDYQPTNANLENAPNYKIGGLSKRNLFNIISGPGPGEYNSKLPASDSKFNFGLKLKDKPDNFPGPGEYEIDRCLEPDNKFTFGVKKISLHNESTNLGIKRSFSPGPAAYNADEYDKKNNISPTIPKSNEDIYRLKEASKLPGPCSYNAEKAYIKGVTPEYTISQSPRKIDFSPPYLRKNPGPSDYSLSKPFESHEKAILFHSKLPDLILKQKAKLPGPGFYKLDFDLLTRKPAYGFPRSPRSVSPKQERSPGPNEYDPVGFARSKVRNLVMGTSPKFEKIKKSPGPGDYELPNNTFEGPEAFFGKKIPLDVGKLKTIIPAPTDLNPIHKLVKPSSPNQIMSKAPKDEPNAKKFIPGPGTYEMRKIEVGPFAKIGNSKRSNSAERMGRTPGPGDYNLKPFIGDLPNYLMWGIDKKIKL